MTPTIVITLTFLGGVLGIAAVYSIVTDLFLRDRDRVSQRLDEFQGRSNASIKRSPLFKNMDKLDANVFGERDSQPKRSWLESMVEQSGLTLTPGRLLLIAAASALGTGATAWALSRWWWLGLVFASLGFAIPILYVHWKRNRRLDKILSQLPDVFELVARLIRAGQTTAQSFQGVADEFEPPIAAEFGYCYEQQNLGLPPEVALRDMARRIDLVEIKIFVLAVLVQQQTGGNLAELIDNLAAIVRERFRIKGKIRVLTAEGRMEASVLLALPPIIFFIILFLNRGYGSTLLQHPHLLWAMGGLMLVGVVWIRRIINFDF